MLLRISLNLIGRQRVFVNGLRRVELIWASPHVLGRLAGLLTECHSEADLTGGVLLYDRLRANHSFQCACISKLLCSGHRYLGLRVITIGHSLAPIFILDFD